MSGTSQNHGGLDRDSIAIRQRALEKTTNLSDRECQVQALLEQGLTRAEIADELGLEKGTIDNYVHRIKEKYSMAYHTVQQLEAVHDGKIPDLEDYTGWVFYYDPSDEFSQDILSPAARVHAGEGNYVELKVTESSRVGGILNSQPVSHVPALVFCEGEPLRTIEGAEQVAEHLATEGVDLVKSLAHEQGYYEPQGDGWDIE